MLIFDENGYLSPADVVVIDHETLLRIFVTNEHRWRIFEAYTVFIEALKSLQPGSFHQWINGSFVSTHPKPADVDVVTFVDYRRYEMLESDLRNLKRNFKFVDAYFVREFPADHSNHFLTVFDKTEWRFLFSTDRKKRKKGFVQLNF